MTALRLQIVNTVLAKTLHSQRYRRAPRPAASHSFITLWLMLVSLSCTVVATASDDNRGSARERIEPEGFLYGFGLSVKSEIYEGYDQSEALLPIIGYRGENLSIFGPFVRYAMLQSGAMALSIQAKPRFAGYEESDSDVFDGMDDRKPSIDFGLGVEYAKNDWKLELSGLHDVLSRSNGTELSIGLSKVFRHGPLFIEPGIGLSYLDSRYVDYYYGVRDSEETSFRPSYEGDDAVNKNLGITFMTPAIFSGLTRLSFEYTWYDSKISDSPLTDEDTSLSLFLTYSRFF